MKTIIFFFLMATSIHAQNSYDYVGFLFSDKGFPISYRLILEENDGTLNGYSITGLGTNYETKNEVFGSKSRKEINLKEYQVITTVSEEPLSTFCYIELTAFKNKNSFSGSFIGRYQDSTICAQGKVTFAKKATLEKKIKKIQKIQKVQELITKRQENKTIVLKSGDLHELKWNSEKFKMNLWDSAIEDGERVTLTINDKVILDNELMTSNKTKVTYKLQKGQNIVVLKADSEGEKANNTTRMELIDKKIKHHVLTELQVGKNLTFKINLQ